MPSGDNLRPEQQRIRRRAQALEKAAAHATSLGCPSACSPLDYDGMTIKPPGSTPRNHYWDPWTAVYRRKETHALHDLPVEHRAQVRASHARVRHAQRLRGHNRARCNEDILKPGFDRASVAAHDGGQLGAETCEYCGALLYPSEAVSIPTRGDLKRGKHCCAEGQVALPPVKEHAAVDALWRGTDEASKTLRKHSRQFNNALALASELYEEVDIDGWAPSLVLAANDWDDDDDE